MRISDWSSDVCSSDLAVAQGLFDALEDGREGYAAPGVSLRVEEDLRVAHSVLRDAAQVGQGEVVKIRFRQQHRQDRKSVVWGKSVSVRVDLGGRSIIKRTNKNTLGTISVLHM